MVTLDVLVVSLLAAGTVWGTVWLWAETTGEPWWLLGSWADPELAVGRAYLLERAGQLDTLGGPELSPDPYREAGCAQHAVGAVGSVLPATADLRPDPVSDHSPTPQVSETGSA